MKELLTQQREITARLGITEAKEVPGNVPGFSSFYDFGIWTPVLAGGTIAGTFTYDVANTSARWTREGNLVFLTGRVRITAIAVAPTGTLTIAGLPFVSFTAGFNTAGDVRFPSWTGITLTGARTQLAGVIGDTQSTISFFESGSNLATASVQGAGLVLVGGVADFRFAGQYRV